MSYSYLNISFNTVFNIIEQYNSKTINKENILVILIYIYIYTGSNSINLNKAKRREDFPAPVRPQTPIFSPPFNLNDTFWSTKGNPGLYLYNNNSKYTNKI